MALSWPHGLVHFPGPLARIVRFFADNWILLVPIAVAILLWRAYLRKGRDPVGGETVVVRYEPPPDVTPGEVGTLVDEKADLRDITATVLDLAVRGYIVIHIEKKTHLFGLISSDEIIFEKVQDKPTDDLRAHEREVHHGLFSGGNRVELSDLKAVFYKRIPVIKNALYDRLVDENYFAAKPGTIRTFYSVMGFVVGAATAGVGIFWALLRDGIFPEAVLPAVVAGVLSLLLFLGFAPAMPRRTKKGVAMRGWALGFEEFVSRVEGDRINADDAREVF